MLGNCKDISPKCEGCAFESESSTYDFRCNYCINNVLADKPEKDNWVDVSKKWFYFDSR